MKNRQFWDAMYLNCFRYLLSDEMNNTQIVLLHLHVCKEELRTTV